LSLGVPATVDEKVRVEVSMLIVELIGLPDDGFRGAAKYA
jgi:hypothetical protein